MSNIKTRKGVSLNLNTGKGIKTANLYGDGTFLQEAGANLKNFSKKVTPYMDSAAGILGGVSGMYGAYKANSAVGETTKYDTALSQIDDSISIGSYDALSDWRSSMPTFNTGLTQKDFDAGLSPLQKGMNILSGAGAGVAAGPEVYSKIALGLVGAGAGVAGLFGAKNKRKQMAREYNLKNMTAEDKVNAMYQHELMDIQEQNKLNAMANLEAKGGKIHIAPSKRGTFKAQAKKMGMGVQEAARHILAHKDRYSPAMRKKANFARNFAHAYGGELFDDGGSLFNFPVEYTHGGYFALDPELIKINQGGTHEMNPLDGVPMGFDENGIPNLVEEGETIFDDYVFSNRLAPTEKQLAEGGLATKYKDHTFADISAKLAKKYEETPNDEIAKESMKEDMQRLRTIQEEVKADKEAEEQVNAANDTILNPDTQVSPTGQMEQSGMEIPQEMPQEMPQEVPMGIEPIEQQPVDMMALGGNLFEPGGNLREKAHRRALRRVVPYGFNPDNYKAEIQAEEERILAGLQEKERREEAIKYIEDKYGKGTVSGIKNPLFSSRVTEEDQQIYRDILSGSKEAVATINEDSAETMGPPKPETKSRNTDGVAGQASRQGVNTALYKEGTTAEQRRDAWYSSSGKALMDSIAEAKKSWTDKGLKGEDLRKEQQAYVDAMNAVQDAYVKAYQAGYDPKTGTSNKEAAVKTLQELWEKNKGNKYFDSLMNVIQPQGVSGDNKNQGWVDSLWGDITRNRNWGLTEYFDPDHIPEEMRKALIDAGLTYSAKDNYGDDGYRAYKFGLRQDDRLALPQEMPKNLMEITDDYADPLSHFNNTIVGERPQAELTKEQARTKEQVERQLAREKKALPTWMRYAPIVGAGLSAIWDASQQPDYSVAEAVENVARNVPRARFNPIGNYLTYRPLDRNYYLNQVRNQGLATDRGILQASGANQGAATAGLLASQFNTQGNIGNSLIQQELANRQNEQQVAQFNRGTDQYNSQGLFNESIYNQRAGMQKSQMGITAAQLRQAERQRRNAALSADLTNLFQGIGDIGWENMNMNMVNSSRANLGYNTNKRGVVGYQAKCGGMLTKKKSRRK